MSRQTVPGGVVHELPADLRKALVGNAAALDAWKDSPRWHATRAHRQPSVTRLT